MTFISFVMLGAAVYGAQAVPPAAGDRCGWTPPNSGPTVAVRSIDDLRAALRKAQPGMTILLEDGEYRLDGPLEVAVRGVVLRGRSGDRDKVLLRGGGMQDRPVGVAIGIAASAVTLADLTVGYVAYHGVQVHGERGASGVTLHNVRVIDTGQQLLKVSADNSGLRADNGVIACSTFEYSTHAPGHYTAGVDVLAGKGWVVRDSRFIRIRGPQTEGWKAGPAILFWANSQDTIVERNVVLDSFRGIAFGVGPGASPAIYARDGERSYDHQGGLIRNNVIANTQGWADEGIELNAAARVQVDHNTLLLEGPVRWAISVRFPQTTAVVRNNLTNRPIMSRDGGRGQMAGNMPRALSTWFVDAPGGNLDLRSGVPAIDAGVLLREVTEDFNRGPRRAGRAPDAGAFEYVPVNGKHTP